jgi:hypothetical protein
MVRRRGNKTKMEHRTTLNSIFIHRLLSFYVYEVFPQRKPLGVCFFEHIFSLSILFSSLSKRFFSSFYMYISPFFFIHLFLFSFCYKICRSFRMASYLHHHYVEFSSLLWLYSDTFHNTWFIFGLP